MRTRALITLALLGALATDLPAAQAGSDSQESESVRGSAPIPEPLLFDMVLPLDTEQGEVEVNSIFRLPVDGGELIWIPEIEGAVLNGLAFDLEIEMLGNRQKGWIVASQVTFGRGFGQHFIHGAQVRVERDDDEKSTEFVALYIPAFRFDSIWSVRTMIGTRFPLDGDDTDNTVFIFNVSAFAETSERFVLGLELDYHGDTRRSETLEVVPQVHLGLSSHFSAQAGFGLTIKDQPDRVEALLRIAYAF